MLAGPTRQAFGAKSCQRCLYCYCLEIYDKRKHTSRIFHSPQKFAMLFVSLFASVARSLTHSGHAKMSRQEEPCPLLKLPSDLIAAALVPHLDDSRSIVSCERAILLHLALVENMLELGLLQVTGVSTLRSMLILVYR